MAIFQYHVVDDDGNEVILMTDERHNVYAVFEDFDKVKQLFYRGELLSHIKEQTMREVSDFGTIIAKNELGDLVYPSHLKK